MTWSHSALSCFKDKALYKYCILLLLYYIYCPESNWCIQDLVENTYRRNAYRQYDSQILIVR